MSDKKDIEYVIVDAVKYVKGTEPKSQREQPESLPKIRKDIEKQDYSKSLSEARKKDSEGDGDEKAN